VFALPTILIIPAFYSLGVSRTGSGATVQSILQSKGGAG